MLETSFGEVSEESEWTLSDFGHAVLHGLEEEAHDIAVLDQFPDMTVEPFSQTW